MTSDNLISFAIEVICLHIFVVQCRLYSKSLELEIETHRFNVDVLPTESIGVNFNEILVRLQSLILMFVIIEII